MCVYKLNIAKYSRYYLKLHYGSLMIYVIKSNNKMPDMDKTLLDSVSILQFLNIKILPFYITKEDIKSIDYILLTSKNAISAILQHEYAELFLQKQAIVIGERTKEKWLQAGGSILFCPKKACDSITLAKLIIDKVQQKNLLYMCGKDIANDISNILQTYCTFSKLIVYESYENSNITKHIFADEDIFIFGSTKNYKIFLKYYTWNPSWFAISLGDTTFANFADDIRKLNAKGDFAKALKVAQAMRNDTPMRDNTMIDENSIQVKL